MRLPNSLPAAPLDQSLPSRLRDRARLAALRILAIPKDPPRLSNQSGRPGLLGLSIRLDLLDRLFQSGLWDLLRR